MQMHLVVSNMLDSEIVGSVFEIQSYYYVPFQTNKHGKGMNPIFLTVTG